MSILRLGSTIFHIELRAPYPTLPGRQTLLAMAVITYVPLFAVSYLAFLACVLVLLFYHSVIDSCYPKTPEGYMQS